MKVILLEKIRRLGSIGDVVSVKPGYGRNFLIPQGKATSATPANVAKFEARRAELEKMAADAFAAAQARAAKLTDKIFTIAMKAGDEGRLFGSVGTNDVAKLITGQGIEVERSEVRMPSGAIRQTGEYPIDLNLHSDVVVTVKINIVAEE